MKIDAIEPFTAEALAFVVDALAAIADPLRMTRS